MVLRLVIVLLFFGSFSNHVLGQTTQTHAEATSQKWKGIDVSTVLGNNSYPDDNKMESGYPFILYNVGTGRFVVQGGDWAMEGRLFYPDFGRTMYLYSNGRINSGLTENGVAVTKNSFCARPPEPFGKSWSAYNTSNLTTLMDGAAQTYYNMYWTFELVEDPSNTDTHTYYMYQTYTKNSQNKKYYLGAAWGEWHVADGKGDGQFIFLDDDRCCWTTATVIGNTNKKTLENGDEIEIQKLYQWRLISLDEFIEVLTQEEVGLNPSISSLIPDRDFTRNSDHFYGNWTVSTLGDYNYSTDKRYAYTWGNYKKQTNQQSLSNRVVKEAWDSPVKLKVVFDKKTSTASDDQQAGMKNAKFGFLPFEGVGTIYTNFEVPKPGWYQIECVGFSMSEQNHDAYLFARVIADTDKDTPENTIPSKSATYGEVVIGKIDFGTFTKESYESCKATGQELLYNADSHRQKVWVLVSESDFEAGKKTIRLGVRKTEATKSSAVSGAYYDTDWVCIDDIRASFMGLAPVFFYDDEEDLTYLSQKEEDRENFSENEYISATLDGRYGGAAALQRSFTYPTDEQKEDGVKTWNTFSFPLPLTGEQVRNAFGDDCELLKLNSIGELSNNENIIDFQTVDLVTLDDVVLPGNLYLLYPTKQPSDGENPRGAKAKYYELGKMFFSMNAEDADDEDYKHPVLDLSNANRYANQVISSIDDKNPGKAFVSYTQTPNYDSWLSIYKDETALASIAGSYVPKGGYAMSGGKMYELNKNTRIKGFRGWITLAHSIFDSSSSAREACISINGVVDGNVPTSIDEHVITPVDQKSIKGIYDLSGRKLNVEVNQLRRGMYIVDGKKLLIK